MIKYIDPGTGDPTVPNGPFFAALGNFDGVHLGHRKVILEMIKEARAARAAAAVWSFKDAPRGDAPRLAGEKEKAALIASLGADIFAAEDFGAVCDLSPEQFVKDYLKNIGCAGVVCGFNFRFGKGAAGDTNTLSDLCAKEGLFFKCVDPVLIGGEVVSSTKIRELLAEGDVASAAVMLGKRYSVCSPVLHGRGLGARFGFPTINQNFDPGAVVLRRGVYYTLTDIDGVIYPSVSNVGSRPTVGGHVCRLETHIPRFDEDLYGTSPEVSFVEFRRPEREFPSEAELISAIKEDAASAIEFYSNKKYATGGYDGE